MGKETDKVVANVYETFDYNKFSPVPENRGQKENKGLKSRKLKTLQHLIDKGTWIHSMSRVKVNKSFQIVDGLHTFEICKANGLSIRYEITEDVNFNEVTKRDLVGSIYQINSVITSWTSSELFNAAVQCKAYLALIMKDIIDQNDNYFLWSDLMALLQKDTRYFIGRWRQTTMQTFEDKTLIELAKSDEFYLELKHFIKLNLKARISAKKGMILKAAYDILWHARDMVNPGLFRKALASIPENWVTSQKTQTDDGCRRMLIQHYNKSQGQEVETATVIFALKHKETENEVLEIQ